MEAVGTLELFPVLKADALPMHTTSALRWAPRVRTGMSPAHGAHKGTFGTVWSSLKVKGSTPLTNHLPVLS